MDAEFHEASCREHRRAKRRFAFAVTDAKTCLAAPPDIVFEDNADDPAPARWFAVEAPAYEVWSANASSKSYGCMVVRSCQTQAKPPSGSFWPTVVGIDLSVPVLANRSVDDHSIGAII